MRLSSQRLLQKAETGQVPGQACSIPVAAAKALILGGQGCTPEEEREDVGETFNGKGWFHIKLKSKLFI